MRLNALRPLGKSGIHVSPIGLGCATFGREIDEETSFAIMDRAFDLGIRLFATAEAYGGGQSREYRRQVYGVDDCREVSGEMHSSEKIVGRWLASRGVRDQIALLTRKLRNYQRASVREALSASLERLRADHADVYLYHQFDPSTPAEEAVAALDEVTASGLTRTGGCSNYSVAQLSEALEISRQQGLRRFEVVECIYNLAVPGIVADLLPLCDREQLGVLGYSPLGAGFLTGKYTPDRTQLPSGSRFHVIPGHADIYFSDRNFRIVGSLQVLARRLKIPAQRLAMAWVFQNSSIANVLIGARNIEQLDNAVEALTMVFEPEWLAEMNSWD